MVKAEGRLMKQLKMTERKSVTKALKKRYKKSAKREKGVILDEFCYLTEYNRKYAARALRSKRIGNKRAGRAGRRRIYGDDVLVPLRKIWSIMDGICGKRLAAVLPEMIESLERFGEIELSGEVKDKLLSISASTIDRMLAPERRKFTLKGRATTKPGTLLKHQIPVRTFSQWDEKRAGFLEIDLVSHDGGNPRGDFAQTLDMVDVHSGWTETKAVKNKAQVWVFEALKSAREDFPFQILGIDSDNGGEFINDQLTRYCVAEKITFTRSRPYKKNDSCHVEQKNWSVVRRNVGYLRYDSEKEVKILNELYGHLRLYTNFFMPQMKLIEKIRVGSKVKKRYDPPQVPYRRLLASEDIPDENKDRLREIYANLNPAQLRRMINKLQDKLYKFCASKQELREKEVFDAKDFEYILDDATNKCLGYIFK